MLTRAYIEEIDYATSKLRVRIPTLNGVKESTASTPSNQLEWASILQVPGIELDYKVGDVVVVGFEDNDLSSPIVLGFLKLAEGSDKAAQDRLYINAVNLSVSGNVTLPTDITFTSPTTGTQALSFEDLWNSVYKETK